MKNLKLFLFATLAMFVAITGVNAAKIKYVTLTDLQNEGKATVSSTDGNVKTYTLSSSLGNAAVEIDKSDIVVDLNGNTIANVKVSADNVTFANTNGGSVTNLEQTGIMNITKDNYAALSFTTITNNGTLTIEKNAHVDAIINSGTLTVAGYVNKISVNDGIVNITKDAVLENGNAIHASGTLGHNYITGGSVTIENGANIPVGYFGLNGGSAIYYGTKAVFEMVSDDYATIKGTSEEGNSFVTVVPRSELKFDVKILDEDEEEVDGALVKGQVYTISIGIYWNGVEVSITDGCYIEGIDGTFKVTSEDILVKYNGPDAQDNQYIALADGVATFELNVVLAKNSDPDNKNDEFKVETDSNHSATKSVEPEKDPGESGGSAVTPGESTDNPTTDETKTPNTVDSIPTYLAAGAVSIIGIALLGFSIKKRMED